MGPELLILLATTIAVVVVVFGIFHVMQYLSLRANTRVIIEQTHVMGSLINEMREQGHSTESKIERLEGRLQRFEDNYEYLRRLVGTRAEDEKISG